MGDGRSSLANRLSATILVAVSPLIVTNILVITATLREADQVASRQLVSHGREAAILTSEWRHDQLAHLNLLESTLTSIPSTRTSRRRFLQAILARQVEWEGIGFLPAASWKRGMWALHPPLLVPGPPGRPIVFEKLWAVAPGMLAMAIRVRSSPDVVVALISEPSLNRLLREVGRSIEGEPGSRMQSRYRIDDWQGHLLAGSPMLPGPGKSSPGSPVLSFPDDHLGIRVQVPSTYLSIQWAEPRHQLHGDMLEQLPAMHLLEMLATLGAILWLRKRARVFMTPIAELDAVARKLGEGNLLARVTDPPPDEFGDLGRTFNAMADQIGSARRDLERAVTERTRELHHSNQDLEEAKARLEMVNRDLHCTVDVLRRLDRQRSEFLDALSHDLRIPLTAIQGQAELLEEEFMGPLVDGQLKAVKDLQEAVRSVTRMLDELLEFARLESGKGKLSCTSFPVMEWLRTTLMPLKILADRRCQLMAMEVDPALSEMIADPDRLQLVMTNIVSNAVKFTPHGGRITIRALRRENRVRFEVEDNGMGILLEEQEKLFQRFYRAKGSEKVPGTGLGLAVSRGIIEMHEGSIGLASTPGKGSLFWFEIPQPDDTLSRHDTETSVENLRET